MFTHSLLLKGFKLVVTPKAVTWHFQSAGGIHDGQKAANWHHDEAIFQEWIKFKRSKRKLYVLDNGRGDHYIFRQAITLEPDAVVACCYPDVFPDHKHIISIADAKRLVDIADYNVYTWCDRHQWKGHLTEAFGRLYEDLDRSR